MVDLSDKGSDSEEMSSKTPEMVSAQETLNQAKTCVDCGTTKTPLWRGGPAGPKSLCNACGIRSRKRRRALLGLNKDDKKSKKNTAVTVNSISNSNNNNSHSEASSSTSNNGGNGDNKMGDTFKRKLVALGNEVMVQRPRSTMTKQRRKLGEEEQAAMVLMYLSGSVFAY